MLVLSSWTPNTDLSELDHETVADMITSKMRKDLQKAHELASENNDLQYYRDLLQKFEEEREQARVEKEEKAKAKAAAAAEKKAKTSVKPAKTPKKSKASVDEDGDMDMEDIGDDDDVPKSKAKKRKAEDASEVSGSICASDRHELLTFAANTTANRFSQEAEDQADLLVDPQGQRGGLAKGLFIQDSQG